MVPEFAADVATTFGSLALGLGLAAATGLRVFLPLLLAGLVVRLGLVDVLSPDAAWLGSTPALIAFGTAAIVEIGAYKIPIVDNLLDIVAAPAALVAGAALTSSFLIGFDDPLAKTTLGIIAGAGAAGAVHGGMATARLISTKMTAGMANPLIALVESIAATVTSVLAFVAPFVVLAVLVVLGLAVIVVVKRRARRLTTSTL